MIRAHELKILKQRVLKLNCTAISKRDVYSALFTLSVQIYNSQQILFWTIRYAEGESNERVFCVHI